MCHLQHHVFISDSNMIRASQACELDLVPHLSLLPANLSTRGIVIQPGPVTNVQLNLKLIHQLLHGAWCKLLGTEVYVHWF